MDPLAYRQLPSALEPDKCIEEMYQQYRRVWYAIYRPFILGPIVTLILEPIVVCIFWLLPDWFRQYEDFPYWFIYVTTQLIFAPTIVFMWGNYWRMLGESEIMRDVLAKPGYMDLLPEMEKIHPKAVKLIRRMTKSTGPFPSKLPPS
ncbi:MAG: hypothetical protein PHC70_02055 [Patescibacteria group bacterium]|nr:hypothetical protein [Patescibacteria group bacterium]